MAVRSLKNHYRGINAHLHSYWQAEGGWHNFHNRHIGDLAGLMRLQLLPMGYTAYMEESLQIRRLGESPRQPTADILLSDLQAERAFHAPAVRAAPHTVADMVELSETRPYRAVVIYESHRPGEPVAWIELLSPSNKGATADASAYMGKRHLLLENGIVFVELDYLHESPPTFPRLSDYSQGKNDAYPYRIVVLDPRPNIKTGPAWVESFNVDEPIPRVEIPLNADDRLKFDFDACYQKTYEEMGYGLELVDYSQLPLHFDRYSNSDQLRILTRMLTVLAAENLEQPPLPLLPAPASVEEGLKRLQL